MADDVIKIAVVGHTNTGKTSLLRTLTRDTAFGEVADSPGTTRHVEGARLRLEGRAVLECTWSGWMAPKNGWTARRASAASSTRPKRTAATNKRPAS
ncbi:hypothetical protein G6F65_022555 [Rhizopus arrhizus]|nr:hypothetical protein G6F65_022555 [Rhizopus arrhizus]